MNKYVGLRTDEVVYIRNRLREIDPKIKLRHLTFTCETAFEEDGWPIYTYYLINKSLSLNGASLEELLDTLDSIIKSIRSMRDPAVHNA